MKRFSHFWREVWIILVVSSFVEIEAGQVFTRVTDAPRTTMAPKPISLVSAPGSESSVRVKAALALIRLDHETTKGVVAFSGRKNESRKFIRLEIQSKGGSVLPGSVEVKYVVEEGGELKTLHETVKIPTPSPAFAVDLDGFTDTYGISVSNTFSATTITSTKTKHASSEIVDVHVTVSDPLGNVLFAGAWPEPAEEVVKLPDILKPRILTNIQGQKIEAMILSVTASKVKIESKGRTFELDLDQLSSADQEFLRGLDVAMAVPPAPVEAKKVTPPLPSLRSSSESVRDGTFEDRGENGALLAGFNYWVANMDEIGIPVVRAMQPIFRGKSGDSEGKILGNPIGKPTMIVSDTGFLVGGIEVASGLAMDRFKVTFLRQAGLDGRLDASNARKSGWCGGDGGDQTSVMGGDGTAVIGIFGSASGSTLKIGLLYEDGTRSRPGDRTSRK